MFFHVYVKYPCQQCDYQATKNSDMAKHNQSVHMGRKYPYQECGEQFTVNGSLTVHQKSIHMGIKYPCQQCEYKATQKSSLTRHHQSVHMGGTLFKPRFWSPTADLKFSINHCDFIVWFSILNEEVINTTIFIYWKAPPLYLFLFIFPSIIVIRTKVASSSIFTTSDYVKKLSQNLCKRNIVI